VLLSDDDDDDDDVDDEDDVNTADDAHSVEHQCATSTTPCTHDKPVVISNTIASDDDETPITRKPIAHSRAVIAIASDDEMVAASPVKARAKPTQRIALRECVDDEAGESVC
jgi:hypothetical protein